MSLEPSCARAIQNENGVDSDMMTLSKWVREDLFFYMIHDLKNGNDKTLDVNGEVCAKFVAYYSQRHTRVLLVNPDITGAPDDEVQAYLKFLWGKGLSKDTAKKVNIRKNLSMEKTAVYSALNDAFKSKFFFDKCEFMRDNRIHNCFFFSKP